MHYQIQDLCEAASDSAIRDIIAHLPEGLHETYSRILDKISKSLNAALAHRVMRWIACARRPLKIRELQEAVAFHQSDDRWDAGKIPDADKLVRSCRGLIVRDQYSIVRFAHHTIPQFLMREGEAKDRAVSSSHPDRQHKLESFFFDEGEGTLMIAEMCATYLCFSDFESALVRNETERRLMINEVFKAGGPISIPAALGLRKSFHEIPCKFFGRNGDLKVPQIDFSKYVGASMLNRQPVPDLQEKYALLAYVVEYWPWHTNQLCAYQHADVAQRSTWRPPTRTL